MDEQIIQMIVQGGGIGLCVLLIWVIYKLVTNHDSHLLDALDRNTKAWSNNEIAITKLVDKLDNIRNH